MGTNYGIVMKNIDLLYPSLIYIIRAYIAGIKRFRCLR